MREGLLEVVRELEALGVLIDETRADATRVDVRPSPRPRRVRWFNRRPLVVVVVTPHPVSG